MVQYPPRLDSTFSALSDPTRRDILTRLGRGDASITDLATRFGMTLTGMKKHISVLENAGLVRTKKIGRVRTARLGTRKLQDESEWIDNYRRLMNERYDALENLLERTKGSEP